MADVAHHYVEVGFEIGKVLNSISAFGHRAFDKLVEGRLATAKHRIALMGYQLDD